MKAVARFLIVVTVLMLALWLPAFVLAAGAEPQSCPQPVNGGVVCTGPAVPPSYLPIVQVGRSCPHPIGGGVVCTGPEIPNNDAPVEAQLGAAPLEVGLYLPMLNR